MVYPSYFEKFRCIGSACRHNCCIGWEIDIDEDTYSYYKTVGGDMGSRLEKGIEHCSVPHFVLGEGERCPFLNSYNLCDIITELGEEHLCGICAEHPRFYNELPDRVEAGIGLTCEEAARIILGCEEPVTLVGAAHTDDEIIILRDGIISVLQNRELPLQSRVEKMLELAKARLPRRKLDEWAEVFMSLERLDEGWTGHLKMLCGDIDFAAFDTHMRLRQNEYEQLCVYFIYRHFANAPDLYETSLRAAFAALGYKILHALGAALFTAKGEFTFADQVELCRMFSSEIEYSDENMYTLFDVLDSEVAD